MNPTIYGSLTGATIFADLRHPPQPEHQGETWQANVTNILNGPTQRLFQGNTLIDYKAAAVIFSDILFQGANARCQLGDLGSVNAQRQEQQIFQRRRLGSL